MILKKLNVKTPSSRWRLILNKKGLPFYNKRKIFKLKKKFKNSSGRNNRGRITVRSLGGGHPTLHTLLDKKKSLTNILGTISSIESSKTRSGFLGLISYENGFFGYHLLTHQLKKGAKIITYGNIVTNLSELDRYIAEGDSAFILQLPLNSKIHSIERIPNEGVKYTLSAGTYSKLLQKYTNGYALISLSSKKYLLTSLFSFATLGRTSNLNHKYIVYGKAGVSRWLNKRSKIRGVAMNPIDHPHGGGQGKSKGGNSPRTPWGIPTKGYKTKTFKFIRV